MARISDEEFAEEFERTFGMTVSELEEFLVRVDNELTSVASKVAQRNQTERELTHNLAEMKESLEKLSESIEASEERREQGKDWSKMTDKLSEQAKDR